MPRREFEAWVAAHEREHAAHGMAHATEHRLIEVASHKADTVMDVRLGQMNEFREQLRDQATTFATIEKHEGDVKLLSARIDRESAVTLKADAQHDLLEQMGTNRRWLIGLAIGTTFSVIAMALTLLTLVLHLVTNNV